MVPATCIIYYWFPTIWLKQKVEGGAEYRRQSVVSSGFLGSALIELHIIFALKMTAPGGSALFSLMQCLPFLLSLFKVNKLWLLHFVCICNMPDACNVFFFSCDKKHKKCAENTANTLSLMTCLLLIRVIILYKTFLLLEIK